MDAVRRILSYLLPVIGLVATGSHNPISPDSPYHGYVVPLAGLIFTFLSLRLNPNGVNGPPAPKAPAPAAPKASGAVPIASLVFLLLAALSFLSLAGCAQAKGALCGPESIVFPISFDDGSVCTFSKAGPAVPGAAPILGLTCREPNVGEQSCRVELPPKVCAP